MTTLSILLQQIKEKEEHDLAYAKKIKEVETLLKAEEETLKKLKDQEKKLSEDLQVRRLRCSEKEIRKLELTHKKQIWEDLLQKAQKDLRQHEIALDELQQSVCLDRLAFCNGIKEFLNKQEMSNASTGTGHHNEASLPLQTDFAIKIEQKDEDNESLIQEMISLENELEKLKADQLQIEEAKKLKARLEAEPANGEEFLRIQKQLKETKESLKKAEEEVKSLKMEIAEQELTLLSRRTSATHIRSSSSQVGEDKSTKTKSTEETVCSPKVDNQQIKTLPKAIPTGPGSLSTPKMVSFNSKVEIKTISPPILNKVTMKHKDRTKSPSAALRKKLAQVGLACKLDETMRDILFKDKI